MGKALLRIFLISFAFLFANCESVPKIKVYQHLVEESCQEKPGFYRKQDNEVMTYGQANLYFAVSPKDMETILNICYGPKTEAQKSAILQYLLNN